MKIGWIGTGVMGAAMVQNLMAAGHQLVVYNRTKRKTDNLVAQGAVWAASPAEVAQQSDVVFTMVGFPKDVEGVYFGETGIFAGLAKGKTVVDMTTSQPKLAAKIAAYATAHGMHALDAPVSGGDIGAKNATLTIMVGGDVTTYQAMLPLFNVIGHKVNHFGAAGTGQHAKMANQIMILVR